MLLTLNQLTEVKVGTEECPISSTSASEAVFAWLSCNCRMPDGRVGAFHVAGKAVLYIEGRWMFLQPHELENIVLLTMEKVMVTKRKPGRPKEGDEGEMTYTSGMQISPGMAASVAKSVLTLLSMERDMDAFPFWVGTDFKDVSTWARYENGIVDYRTLEFFPDDWRFVNPITVAAKWTPGAECPRFEQFLEESFKEDKGAAEALACALGMGHIGARGAPRKAVGQFGKARSGKGVSTSLQKRLIGKKWCKSTTAMALSGPHGMEGLDVASTIVVNEAGDMEASQRRALSTITKQVIGDDDVPVNPKGVRQHNAVVQAQVFFQANSIPSFADAKGSISGKLVILPYRFSYLGKEDVHLVDKLWAEREGVCQLIAKATNKLLTSQKWPRSIYEEEQMREFLGENNPVQAFIKDMLLPGAGADTVPIARIRSYWLLWKEWKHMDVQSVNERTLGQKIVEEAHWEVKKGQVGENKVLVGLKWNPDAVKELVVMRGGAMPTEERVLAEAE